MLNSILDFDGYLKELSKHGWHVSSEGQFIHGPNDEFFTFMQMREEVFEPRKRKFLQYFDENGFNYDATLRSISLVNLAVGWETVESLLRNFILKEKNKLVKSNRNNA